MEGVAERVDGSCAYEESKNKTGMKQWRIFTQQQAKEDTDEIWNYIAQDNSKAAEEFLDAIEEISKHLSVFPATGGLRYFYHAELHGLRILPLPKFEKYILFYRLKEEEKVVEIVRIVQVRGIFQVSLNETQL
jgi:toxin ParE1/3/4